MKEPQNYVYKELAGSRWIPLVGFSPLLIGIVVMVGTLFTGESQRDDWLVPIVGFSMMGIGGATAGSLVGIMFTSLERWKINRVINKRIVVWEQLSEQEWIQFRQKQFDEDMEGVYFAVAPLVIIGVIIAVIGGMGVANDADSSILFMLLGFWIIVVGFVCFSWLISRYEVQRQFRRRRKMNPPRVFIAKHGFYHEDTGFESLDNLQTVTILPQKGKNPSQIKWTVKRNTWGVGIPGLDTILLFLGGYNHLDHEFQAEVTVNIPDGKDAELEILLQEFGGGTA